MRGRLIIVVLAAVAVVIAVSQSGKGSDKPAGGRAAPRAGASGLHLSLVYSPEKEPLLKPLIARFNRERHRSEGTPVVIDPQVVASGEAEARIAAGRLRPVLWSPASSFWGRLLDYQADSKLAADENPSIVRTPLVIAMWKRLADAYGYPRRPLGYKQLDKLATGGWAAAGKPEFGPFKYVHTNPDFSTSGVEAVVASYYAAAGKSEGLTDADVARARPRVRRLERSIVHYGDTTLLIADQMRRRGVAYASAVAMEEVTLLDFNRTARAGEKLVAVYPPEGTFVSDNPLITLRGSWVSAPERRAGAVFADFLASAITPEVAGRQGFRPADPNTPPAWRVTPANGVDPEQPDRVLSLPEPRVLARVKAAWRADRKPANVMIVFDSSASMSDAGKIDSARAGLKAFIRAAGPRDRIGLTKFSDQITPLVPIGPVRRNRAKLLAAADAIIPDGQTRVRDATAGAVRTVAGRLDPDAINAVVVLTDGQDTSSRRTGSDVVRELSPQGSKESGPSIRVFAIGYGKDANQSELESYAKATGGQAYAARQADVRSIYLSVSSFF